MSDLVEAAKDFFDGNSSHSSSDAGCNAQPVCGEAVAVDCGTTVPTPQFTPAPEPVDTCVPHYDFVKRTTTLYRQEPYTVDVKGSKTVFVDKEVPSFTYKCVQKEIPISVRKMVTEEVPSTKTVMQKVEEPGFKWVQQKVEVPTTKIESYDTQVEATRKEYRKVKVPTTNKVMKQVCEPATKTVSAWECVDTTKIVKVAVQVPTTVTVKVPQVVKVPVEVVKYRNVTYQKPYQVHVPTDGGAGGCPVGNGGLASGGCPVSSGCPGLGGTRYGSGRIRRGKSGRGFFEAMRSELEFGKQRYNYQRNPQPFFKQSIESSPSSGRACH